MDDTMRRNDRRLSAQLTNEILEKGTVCQLALAAQGEPYLVTMNYGYRDSTLYFHCAAAGKKLEVIEQNNRVCFTVVEHGAVLPAEKPCDFTMKFRSVVGFGTARVIDGYREKCEALGIIMAQYAPGESFQFPEGTLAATTVFAVDISSMAAKSNL
ncbi:pyridoxamine 5'-phosphate oxidase family protein [Geomonas anaerohicana]|uniref:Pyridoxamine 5'-phosphate oxidase family protein n=1 Tax=Geomonas anaerohicana TaxID=2798583 RepID=A0ABS0YFA8_9BACT|nr:pyridoxamine 5'-phosphate oxidase family protein [Geomonas anaerohicana]MBJ6750604.1 pyridoxamine 5'-phosphate oxidase family protein [Geomonas anaerohicana]